jgi:TetR/AcrR family transcriptional regulator
VVVAAQSSEAVVPAAQRDAVRTRSEILDVATREFAASGFAGARVDEIAAKTRTTKRMIYYYFGSKEQLFVAVLEREYARIRGLESELDVEHLDPLDAVRQLVGLTFDHHEAHPDFIRLVSIENIHQARHIAGSKVLAELGHPALDTLTRILDRGREAGRFRADADPLDVHMMISAFCVFRIANRHTFEAIFGRDLLDPERRDHDRRMIGDLVVKHLSR